MADRFPFQPPQAREGGSWLLEPQGNRGSLTAKWTWQVFHHASSSSFGPLVHRAPHFAHTSLLPLKLTIAFTFSTQDLLSSHGCPFFRQTPLESKPVGKALDEHGRSCHQHQLLWKRFQCFARRVGTQFSLVVATWQVTRTIKEPNAHGGRGNVGSIFFQ